MGAPNGTLEPAGAASTRLNGWKEIAGFIGRGVRTAQRWERDLGMPVHRLSTGPRDAVFALRDELDTWMSRQSHASLALSADEGEDVGAADGGAAAASGQWRSAGPVTRRRWWPWLLGPALALALALGIVWVRPMLAPVPVSVDAAGRLLRALGPDGEVLWERTLPAPANWLRDPAWAARAVALGDITGDGRSDVILAGSTEEDGSVHAWDHRGRPLFTNAFTRAVRFGAYACPPTRATHAHVESLPRFPGTVWVWGHHPVYFPAVLQRLDGAGRVQSEYWSNGHIRIVESVVLGGRPVTIVGAVNNDQRGASLAVFFGDANGSAPSAAPSYTCIGCPPGTPDAFLVFPRSRLQAAAGALTSVIVVTAVGPDQLVVGVEVGLAPVVPDAHTVAYYTLDKDLRVLAAELDNFAEAVHRQRGARFGPSADTRYREADLFPVKRWNGTGWDLIPGPEGGAAPVPSR